MARAGLGRTDSCNCSVPLRRCRLGCCTAVADRLRQYDSGQWEMAAGIGVDRGKLLVRQLEIRGTGMNEVWAGTPVNTVAKLSGVAGLNEVAVSDRGRLREQRED